MKLSIKINMKKVIRNSLDVVMYVCMNCMNVHTYIYTNTNVCMDVEYN